MDLYNRWCMRASGERQHQAQTLPERATYAALALLASKDLIEPFLGGTEAEKSTAVTEMHDRFARAFSD